MQTIVTSKLTATPFSQNDYIDLCQLHQDVRVMATLGGIRSAQRTQQFLDEKIAHRKEHGFGYWMFRDKEDGRFVARGGIQHVKVAGKPEIEIGYTVRFSEWGKGLATEIAQALLSRCFGELCLDNIVCFTLVTNEASERVMQKVRFRFERRFDYREEPHLLYRITRSEYENRML